MCLSVSRIVWKYIKIRKRKLTKFLADNYGNSRSITFQHRCVTDKSINQMTCCIKILYTNKMSIEMSFHSVNFLLFLILFPQTNSVANVVSAKYYATTIHDIVKWQTTPTSKTHDCLVALMKSRLSILPHCFLKEWITGGACLMWRIRIWSSRWRQKDCDKHLLKAMTRFIFSGCLMTGRPSILEGDVFFNLICGHCSPNGEESVTRMKLQWWRHSRDLQHTELFWKNKSCYYEMWHYFSSTALLHVFSIYIFLLV